MQALMEEVTYSRYKKKKKKKSPGFSLHMIEILPSSKTSVQRES